MSQSVRPQRVQRWILLLMSIIALAIWGRNLVLFMPTETKDNADEQSGGPPGTSTERHVLTSARVMDSLWHDPFAPPLQVNRPHRPADSLIRPSGLAARPTLTPPPWTLAGVVWDRKSPSAILTSLDGSQRIVVARGDTLGPIRIERIDESHVWLRHQGRSWKLALQPENSASAH